MKKNILLAGVIIVFLLAAGSAAYLLFFRAGVRLPSPPVAGRSPTPTPTTSAPASKVPATLLSANYTVSPVLSPAGNKIRYFDKTEGLLREVVFSGGAVSNLSSAKFSGVYSVLWSPAGDAVILEYIDPAGEPAKTFFAFGTTSAVQLDKNVKEVAWSPDGKQIVYHYRNTVSGENYIATANPDGTKSKAVFRSKIPAVKLFWPTVQEVFVLEKPAPQQSNALFKIDLKTNATKLLFNSYQALELLPALRGKSVMLISYLLPAEREGEGDTLRTEVVNFSGESLATLPFAAIVDKCSWANDGETIYCAVPDPAQGGAPGFPFAFWTGEWITHDSITKYNYMKKSQAPLPSEFGLDATSLVIAQQEDFLSFISRNDNSLYSLKL